MVAPRTGGDHEIPPRCKVLDVDLVIGIIEGHPPPFRRKRGQIRIVSQFVPLFRIPVGDDKFRSDGEGDPSVSGEADLADPVAKRVDGFIGSGERVQDGRRLRAIRPEIAACNAAFADALALAATW